MAIFGNNKGAVNGKEERKESREAYSCLELL